MRGYFAFRNEQLCTNLQSIINFLIYAFQLHDNINQGRIQVGSLGSNEPPPHRQRYSEKVMVFVR